MKLNYKNIIACFLLMIFLCKGVVFLCVNASKISFIERITSSESEGAEKGNEERVSEKEFVAFSNAFKAPVSLMQTSLKPSYSRYKAFLSEVFLAVFTPPPELV